MREQFTYITSVEEASRLASQLLSDARVIGLDTETTGLDPRRDRVILLSITANNSTYVIDTRDVRLLEVFRDVLENERILKIGVNLNFDYQMIKGSSGIDVEGIRDLMLAEQAMTAGIQFDGYGLEAITKKYLKIDLDKGLQTSFVNHHGDFSKEQLRYAASDTSMLMKLGEIMQSEMKDLGVRKAWVIESNAIPAFADMEYFGQKIDTDSWSSLILENQGLASSAKTDLDSFFVQVCDTDTDGRPVINYNSQAQLLAGLKHLGLTVDGELISSTDKKVQKKLKDQPVIQALGKFRAAVKRVGTYGDKYLKAIHPITGRIHFKFRQYGTETGRPACMGGLNCLNIPRDKKYRKAFITEPGRLISTVDYSAAELRILADLSGEPLMIDGFNSGVDFHCYVASQVFKKEVTKKNENAYLRDPTKTINFGIAYGLGPGSLFEQLNGMGHKCTREEAREIFDQYKATFPTMIKWLEEQQSEASKSFQMVNINGRMRRWIKPNRAKITSQMIDAVTKGGKLELTDDMDKHEVRPMVEEKMKSITAAIKREGANFQIQSVNADFTKAAMYELRKEFKRRGWDARMYNSVYDEIVMDMDAGIAEEAHELQKTIMKREADKMLKSVPMEVEGHLETHWTK